MNPIYKSGQFAVKRLIDILGALLMLTLLAPVFAALSLLIFLKLGRPIFFVQERAGQFGRPFKIYKFRTMSDERNTAGVLLSDELRIGSMGRFIRSTSLDELPQLWNVITGKMSLVGPRPLLTAYLPLYSSRQAMRHRVRPGITGLAQVSGRNGLSWEERLELDVQYVENWGLLLDLKILAMTPFTVLSRKGVTQAGSATMEKFRGDGS